MTHCPNWQRTWGLSLCEVRRRTSLDSRTLFIPSAAGSSAFRPQILIALQEVYGSWLLIHPPPNCLMKPCTWRSLLTKAAPPNQATVHFAHTAFLITIHNWNNNKHILLMLRLITKRKHVEATAFIQMPVFPYPHQLLYLCGVVNHSYTCHTLFCDSLPTMPCVNIPFYPSSITPRNLLVTWGLK